MSFNNPIVCNPPVKALVYIPTPHNLFRLRLFRFLSVLSTKREAFIHILCTEYEIAVVLNTPTTLTHTHRHTFGKKKNRTAIVEVNSHVVLPLFCIYVRSQMLEENSQKHIRRRNNEIQNRKYSPPWETCIRAIR